jgi:hypothetical protein
VTIGRWRAVGPRLLPLGFLPVLVWLTWPLLARCPDHFIDTVARGGGYGWAGLTDMHMSAWALAWDAHALTTSPFRLFDANIFYPAPYSLAYSEHFLGHLPVALPVYLGTGNPVLAFNAALLASWLGSALAMYALVRRWTASGLAAFAAGVTFAQVGHELQVVGTAYLPLVPLFLDRWLERRRRRDLVALGLCLLVQTLCSYYQGYAAFLLLGAHLLIRLARGPRAGLGPVVGAGVAAALLVALASLPYLRLATAGVLRPVELPAAELMSLPLRLLAPGAPWFPGWIAIGLGLVGIVARPQRPEARLLAVVVGSAGLVLSAGPWEQIAGARVQLPYAWLHALVPGFSSVRFPVRLLGLARFGGAILVGLGLARVGWGVRYGGAVRAALLLALMATRLPNAAITAVRPASLGTMPSGVYEALARSAGDGALLELPLGGGLDPRGAYRESTYMLASTLHWKPLVNGYSGYLPPTYDLLASKARRLPEAGALQDLVDFAGLRWVVLHEPPGRVRDAWKPLVAAGFVRPLVDANDAVLFEVLLPPTRADLIGALRAAVLRRPVTTLLGTSLAELPPSALRATVTFPRLPERVQRGGVLYFVPAVRNDGDAVWPCVGVWPDGLVVADARWRDADGRDVGPRTLGVRLPRDLAPGDNALIDASIAVPREPGAYTLEVRLRQDGRGRESEPASVSVHIPR